MKEIPQSNSNLISKPVDEISFHDLLRFCELGRKEGIDLDYKQDWPNDLARVICAFANTQGGIALIGIEEEGKSRRPKCPPIGVPGSEADLRQRALNVAFDGIFPPVEPEVAVCPDSSSDDRYVVVIRVNPSSLMHATDRRTRIYIRSKDSNRGYELASLSELRWLSDERDRSLKTRSNLLSRAKERSKSQAIGFEEAEAAKQWSTESSLEIAMLPEFPTGRPVVDLRDLFDAVNDVGQVRSEWPHVDRRVPWQFNQWRAGPGAVTLKSKGMSPLLQYVEFGQFGHAYFEFNLEPRPANSLHSSISDTRQVINAYAVLAYIDISVRFASKLFGSLGYRWPMLLLSQVDGVENTLLYYNVSRTNYLRRSWISDACPDNSIDLLGHELMTDALDGELLSFFEESSRKLLWAFGLPWSRDQVEEWLSVLLGVNKNA